MKALIAYYSRAGENYVSGAIRDLKTGNTEAAALALQELIHADVFKIEPCTPYAKDYSDCINQAKCDQLRAARPALTGLPENIGQYDTLYLGFPNYWGTMPMPVFTFLEQCGFQGEKIILFCTHEGDGFGHSEADVLAICPKVEIECGPVIRGACIGDADKIMERWLNGKKEM